MFINKKGILLYIILFIFVVITFAMLNYNQSYMYVDFLGNNIKLNTEDILIENNEYYLSYDFIKENIDTEIYYDSISKKIVIASTKCLLKAKIDEMKVSNNFEEESIENIGVLESGKEYISLEVLRKAYDYEILQQDNIIYFFNGTQFKCNVKYNGLNLHESANLKSKIVDTVDKEEEISGIIIKDGFVMVKSNTGKIGYISNKLVEYEITKENNEKENISFSKYIFADNTNTYISGNLDLDGIFVNMFDVAKRSGEVTIRNIDNDFLASIKTGGYKVYGIVTNGFELSGFSTVTLSQNLADENKRLIIMNNLVQSAEKYNIDGIVIDFRLIKESDIKNFIQFIKEFNAFYDKELIISIDANEYKNYIDAIKYSDFSIINFYGLRNITSIVAGSVSEIPWMENVINEILKFASADKIVACIPAYSILWTEKNSKVIGAQIYNLDAINDYISKNSLTKKYIQNLQQNYVELKKGNLVYKLWVEDETSIKNRIRIVRNNSLRGIAIYKLGYENNNMYEFLNIE